MVEALRKDLAECSMGESQGQEELKGEWQVPKRRSHRLYKKLASISGEVNGLSHSAIKHKLVELGLSDRGALEVINKRLKQHLRREAILADPTSPRELFATTQRNPYGLQYLLIVDFEATCVENKPMDYIHEIIEFPVLLLNINTLEIESEFHSYCRPWLTPNLSEFCTHLTGISQSIVDQAPKFPQVLKNFNQWLASKMLQPDKFCFVTDCPWDIRDCLFPQCALSSCPFPPFAAKWIDVRKLFSSFYNTHSGNLTIMLEKLGMEFEGRQHCGLDDARNICRIMCQLIRDGCGLQYNRFIPQDALRQLSKNFR